MRKPIVDGIFYPADKKALADQVKELLNDNQTEAGKADAILVPHAGYNYTGALAAAGFKSAMGRDIHTAVVLAPVTRDAQDGLFLCDYDAFQTPLGDMPVAQELCKELLDYKGRFAVNNFPFLEEHSIEVQLPFIQHLWPESTLVPIHMGRQNSGTVKQLTKALKGVFADKMESTLFVISANTSPYLMRSLAQEYADSFLALATGGGSEAILAELQKRTPLPNGTGCAAAVMGMAGNKPAVTVLGTADSGGEKIVCYASLAISF